MAPPTKAAQKFVKYTVQPRGIGGLINRLLTVDPNRSTGIPLNPQFRNPPPGAYDPNSYDDRVTVPAGDIADNPYWKRDSRRHYARPSVLKPADVVGLLTVGSKAAPKEDVLLVGDAGQKQLVELKTEGEKGLATFFESKDKSVSGVLDANGLPPFPANIHPNTKVGAKEYKLLPEEEQEYASNYPCRTFV